MTLKLAISTLFWRFKSFFVISERAVNSAPTKEGQTGFDSLFCCRRSSGSSRGRGAAAACRRPAPAKEDQSGVAPLARCRSGIGTLK